MTKIGYNINLSAIDNQAQPDAKIAGADMHLLMTVPQLIDGVGVNGQTEINQIANWKQALPPNTNIVWRTYSKKEGNWKEFPNNSTIVTRWQLEGHLDIIRDDPSNEVSLIGDNKQINEEFVVRSVDLLEQASAAGITVAIGAFSVGTPHHNLIADGTYDDLIRAVVKGNHYFSVHEYCPGIVGAGDVFPYDELLNPKTVLSKMKDELWPLGGYWLLRRSDRFVKQARQLGLADPQIIITESFIDYIPDAQIVLTQLRDEYGQTPCLRDMRGILAWRDYYAEAFKEMHLLSHYELQVRYLLEKLATTVYNQDWIKGVCLFALNKGWDSPECHNWLNDSLKTVRQLHLPNINRMLGSPTPPDSPVPELPTPPSDWEMREGLISSNLEGGSNIRANYTQDAAKWLSKIGMDAISGLISVKTVSNEGFEWHKVIIGVDVGYVAKTSHIVITRPDNEVPDSPEIDYDKIQKMIDTSISEMMRQITKALEGII